MAKITAVKIVAAATRLGAASRAFRDALDREKIVLPEEASTALDAFRTTASATVSVLVGLGNAALQQEIADQTTGTADEL